jgi:hypothetical protein
MRMTGSTAHRHQSWFQVVVPETGHMVAKSGYDYVQAGWRACVVPLRPASRSTVPKTSAVVRLRNGLVVWGGLAVAAMLLWITADSYLSQRERAVQVMTAYGEQFMREFTRPLVDPTLHVTPIQSRIRVSPDGGCLEIYLAPAGGRRYPNLSDHKENVVYDVGRIVGSLRNPSFVCRPIYAKGKWVVVPFQFHNTMNKEGIS